MHACYDNLFYYDKKEVKGELITSVDEVAEAEVHFELYRHLMNAILSEGRFNGVHYMDVIPEKPVAGKSADLVVRAKLEDSLINFLVIEVKRRIKSGLTVFNSDAKEQAKKYAMNLNSLYYVVTDGQRIRLFQTPDEPHGNYAFSLDKNSIRKFLEGLSDLHVGKASRLPFDFIPDPISEIEKQSKGFTKMLLELLEELSSQGKIVIKQRGHVKYLGVGSYQGLLRLGVYEDHRKNYIDFRLELLRKALELDRYVRLMKKLSEVPGFEWVWNEESYSEPNTWKKFEKIITEVSDMKSTRESLKAWLIELEETLAV